MKTIKKEYVGEDPPIVAGMVAFSVHPLNPAWYFLTEHETKLWIGALKRMRQAHEEAQVRVLEEITTNTDESLHFGMAKMEADLVSIIEMCDLVIAKNEAVAKAAFGKDFVV